MSQDAVTTEGRHLVARMVANALLRDVQRALTAGRVDMATALIQGARLVLMPDAREEAMVPPLRPVIRDRYQRTIVQSLSQQQRVALVQISNSHTEGMAPG